MEEKGDPNSENYVVGLKIKAQFTISRSILYATDQVFFLIIYGPSMKHVGHI